MKTLSLAESWDGYVYLLESNGLYKIGYSTHPQSRLRRLQTGSPCPIRIVHTLRTAIYREIEQQLHSRFWKKRLHGEWFDLDDDDITYIKELNFYGVSKATLERTRARDEAWRRKMAERPVTDLEPWNEDLLGPMIE